MCSSISANFFPHLFPDSTPLTCLVNFHSSCIKQNMEAYGQEGIEMVIKFM